MKTSVKNAVIGAVVSMAVSKGVEISKIRNIPACYPTGATGYLDYFEAWMLPSPVMIGEDRSGRPFVAIRYKGAQEGQVVVEVLHQRYTDSSAFTSAGHWGTVLGDHPRLAAEGTDAAWLHLHQQLEKIEFV